MPRPLNDSTFLYGFHDPGGEQVMADARVLGWIVFTEKIGADPGNRQGRDYSSWADQGFGIIVRLNNGYEPEGTIPPSPRYPDFARRCANYVAASRGCHLWIIGNEPNFAVERPGVQLDRSQNPPRIVHSGEVITPALYSSCYRQCRSAIKALPDHGQDQVLVAAVAPWNAHTTYPGNEQGDWVKYLTDVLSTVGAGNCDGITLHAYTHGPDPQLIYTDAYMQPPFQNRQYNFRVYQDFLRAVPPSMRALPVYLTETDQNEPWNNQNVGWVQRAYGEIDAWNKKPNTQKVRALVLYRWPKGLDQWGIENKGGIIEDFRQAMTYRYSWAGLQPVEVYSAQFVSHNTPAQLTAGQAAPVALTVRNSGTRTWQAGGANAVSLGYRWFDSANRPLGAGLTPDGQTPLPADVAPNEQITVRANLAAPPEAGSYLLQWDLYESGKGWFGQQGSSPLTVKVRAQAVPLPEVITFPETGRTARGAFANFYRQYGLEITGYPITDEYVSLETGLRAQDWQRVLMEQSTAGKIRLRAAGELLQELQKKVSELEAEIERLKATPPPAPPEAPAVVDISAQLPRDVARYHKRTVDDIKYVVINHTGVRADIGAERVAQAHRAVWPGIVAHYFITADGQIQQTNAVEDVVTRDQEHLWAGISVYVAGNFNEAAPSAAQMAALGSLVAWLLYRYRLDEAAIRGAGEFVATQSPGLQWLSGVRWKDQLLDRVRRRLTTPAVQPPAERAPGSRAAMAEAAQDEQLATQVAGLQQQVRELQAQIAAAESDGLGKVAAPAVVDIMAKLPRDANSLKTRTAADMRYIVFNHTAVDPSVSVERIAAAHQRRWGSIMYQYVIAADGQILQTNRLEQVVDTSQGWIGQGINIAVAGNFTAEIPSAAQLTAAAHLSAWLMQEYSIAAANVKGACEFIVTQSPGDQWLQGKAWKNLLLTEIAEVQNAAGPDTTELARLRAEVRQLRDSLWQTTAERDRVQAQVAALTAEKTSLQTRIAALEAEVKRLKGGGGTAGKAPKPPMVEVVDSLPKHKTNRYETRSLDKITHIAIHHSAAAGTVTPQQIAAYHVSKDWPGIGYHFYIIPDGTIYHTNNLETISHHVYDQNSYAVGICLAGTFKTVAPSPQQIASIGSLVAWLMQTLNVPEERVWGHKQFPNNGTECPGDQFYTGARYREQILARARAALGDTTGGCEKPVHHYVLFWQNSHNWASDDWRGANNYIAKFRPTAGFSAEDAAAAEYVTIVGGPLGVSAKTESELKTAGCKVERVAGNSFEETKRLLDEMAAQGKRFRTLNG